MICRSSGRLSSEPGAGVQRRVEREAEDEVDEERHQQPRRQSTEGRGRELPRPEHRVGELSRQHQREDRGQQDEAHLGEPGEPDPADLADDELGRGRGGDQELHDAARLLGDHAGRDPQAVEHERQERQHHEHDADDPPAGVLRRVDRQPATAGRRGGGGVDDAERGHGERRAGVGRLRRGPVEDADAECADLQQLGPVRTEGSRGQDLEVEAMVGLALDDHRAGQHSVTDVLGRRIDVRAYLEVEACARSARSPPAAR